MELIVVGASTKSLKGIGHLLTPERWDVLEQGTDFAYADIDLDLGLLPPCSAGVLESRPRPMVLSRMERHLRTKEALIVLEGDAVFCIAPPQESANGELSGITAVRICAGQALILETGAWHWIPFPVGDKAARLLVVFRSGTGRDDLYFHDFTRSHSVRL
jgi:hypothetical protein